MENRHGSVVDMRVTQAAGMAEGEAALAMAKAIPGPQRVPLGGDKNSAPGTSCEKCVSCG